MRGKLIKLRILHVIVVPEVQHTLKEEGKGGREGGRKEGEGRGGRQEIRTEGREEVTGGEGKGREGREERRKGRGGQKRRGKESMEPSTTLQVALTILECARLSSLSWIVAKCGRLAGWNSQQVIMIS